VCVCSESQQKEKSDKYLILKKNISRVISLETKHKIMLNELRRTLTKKTFVNKSVNKSDSKVERQKVHPLIKYDPEVRSIHIYIYHTQTFNNNNNNADRMWYWFHQVRVL
jgi:hypothetical protein